MITRAPDILVFDSGLGGLTVLAEAQKLRAGARYRYAADDAVFPYGEMAGEKLVTRVGRVLAPLIAARAPDVLIIACNTASTLVLPVLRAAHPDIPIVGTVPAIKPAAQASRSRMISVLATPGTAARDYTRGLIESFAGHCRVTLVGSPNLAGLAEVFMRGGGADEAAIAREIAPCFVERDGRRTDHIVLACTHYPLLLDIFRRLAPWEVEWVDSAPAIARRADALLHGGGIAAGAGAPQGPGEAWFTSGHAPDAALLRLLARFNLVPPRAVAPLFPLKD